MEKSKDFFDPFADGPNPEIRFLPNNDQKRTIIPINLPVFIGKVQLLRAIYPYLKILKDNPYIIERSFHTETIHELDHMRNLPSVCYSYRFTFRPFKKGADSDIRLEIGIDPFSDQIVLSAYALGDQ